MKFVALDNSIQSLMLRWIQWHLIILTCQKGSYTSFSKTSGKTRNLKHNTNGVKLYSANGHGASVLCSTSQVDQNPLFQLRRPRIYSGRPFRSHVGRLILLPLPTGASTHAYSLVAHLGGT